jgi:hypothetical protein
MPENIGNSLFLCYVLKISLGGTSERRHPFASGISAVSPQPAMTAGDFDHMAWFLP